MVNNPLLERLWQRPYWFQETVCEWWQDPANAGSIRKLLSRSQNAHVGSCVWVCAHKWKELRSLSHGWLKPKFAWALLAWLQCSSCSKRPGEMPSIPSVLLPSWVLMFHLLLDRNSMSLWVLCGANKLLLFLPIPKHCKRQEWAGDYFLGREPQIWAQWWEETTPSMYQDLCLCMPLLRGAHTHPDNNKYRQTHRCTHTSVNPIEV